MNMNVTAYVDMICMTKRSLPFGS